MRATDTRFNNLAFQFLSKQFYLTPVSIEIAYPSCPTSHCPTHIFFDSGQLDSGIVKHGTSRRSEASSQKSEADDREYSGLAIHSQLSTIPFRCPTLVPRGGGTGKLLIKQGLIDLSRHFSQILKKNFRRISQLVSTANKQLGRSGRFTCRGTKRHRFQLSKNPSWFNSSDLDGHNARGADYAICCIDRQACYR
jgi:hypothetical protein